MAACMVGWAHSPFGRFEHEDLESLIVGVTRRALDDAKVGAEEVDGIWLGNLNGGLIPDSFCSSLVLQAADDLRWAPATRVENACASGAAAVYAALNAIEAGQCRMALVVGAEKMTAVSGADVTRALGSASYVKEEAAMGMTFPGIFASLASDYFERYGDHSETLARIAAKNHRNGVDNPWAQMRKEVPFEFCNTVSDKNPLIAEPLRKTDCSLVSDGAAAMLLVDESLLPRFARGVRFRARKQVNDFLPLSRRDPVSFAGPQRAWREALALAGCTINDLSLAEVHDCFTMAELLCYEAMGLAPAGQGRRVVDDGTVYADGRLPVNRSGGLKAKGHPIGATGVSMHVLAAMQLCGEAGAMQIPGASLAGVFNMGGSAVANYVSILEAAR
ncbi:MAG: acetyl-CoA acetyltransferase [Betaproteobacteria bacterium HGW-Betaproteobacteria-12]|nr:MAG: acetyl-CoA acetyltransferase [Betaproteobacteria bacterium HGW-Betaproteobacteria-12]